MFAPGGALDSQTTDSQWEVGLGFTAEEFESLRTQFKWREGRFVDRDGQPVDVTHVFDPVSPYITPATPKDARVLVESDIKLKVDIPAQEKKEVGK